MVYLIHFRSIRRWDFEVYIHIRGVPLYVAKGRNRGRERKETLCIIASEQAIYIVISTG